MNFNFTAVFFIDAEKRAHNLGTAGPHQTRNPQDLAFANRKRNVVEHARTVQIINFKNDFARRYRALRIVFRQRTADHIGHDAVHRRLLDRLRGNRHAVAHHGHRVAKLEYFLHAVRDVNDADAFCPHLIQYPEQHFGFPLTQGGGRFIHDHDLRVKHQHAHDFRQLLLPDGALLRLFSKRQGNIQFVTFGRRQFAHAIPVQHAPRIFKRTHQKKIFQDRQIRPNIQFLMDKRNPCIFRFTRRSKYTFRTVHQNRAVIGLMQAGQNVHQSRLAGPVFTH